MQNPAISQLLTASSQSFETINIKGDAIFVQVGSIQRFVKSAEEELSVFEGLVLNFDGIAITVLTEQGFISKVSCNDWVPEDMGDRPGFLPLLKCISILLSKIEALEETVDNLRYPRAELPKRK